MKKLIKALYKLMKTLIKSFDELKLTCRDFKGTWTDILFWLYTSYQKLKI